MATVLKRAPIGIRRLLARPTAEFCADVKIYQELTEHHYHKQRET